MSRRFIILPARILDDEDLTRSDLRILCAFGQETDRNGWCKVKQSTIAEKANLSRPYVNDRIRHLSDAGYLEQHHAIRDGRGRGASRYRLLFDYDVPPDADSDASPDAPDPMSENYDIGPPDVRSNMTSVVNSDLTAKDTFRSSLPENGSVERARGPDLLSRLSDGLRKVTGNAVDWQNPSIAVLTIPLGWVNHSGFDLDLDILPTVQAICRSREDPEPIRSWNYFRAAIARNHRDRTQPINPQTDYDRPRQDQFRKSDDLDRAARIAAAALELPNAG